MGGRRRPAGPEGTDADRYRVVAREAEAELRERGSRFRGRCWPCGTEAEARERVARLAARDHDATHHAWGLRLGHADATIGRWSDAGEPAGTAGPPILAAIDGRGLTGTLAVVSRWFGGTKLGTAGLVRCYGAAAAAALDAAGAEVRVREAVLQVRARHADLAAVRRALHLVDGRIRDAAYAEEARLTLAVRRSLAGRLREVLVEATAGRIVVKEISE